MAGPGRKPAGHCPQPFAVGTSTGKGSFWGAWTLSPPERWREVSHPALQWCRGRRRLCTAAAKKGKHIAVKTKRKWQRGGSTGRCGGDALLGGMHNGVVTANTAQQCLRE